MNVRQAERVDEQTPDRSGLAAPILTEPEAKPVWSVESHSKIGPCISSAAVAFPDHYYRQEEIAEALQKLWDGQPYNQERMRAFHRNMKIRGRHLALPLESYLEPSRFSDRNQAWMQLAVDLGEKVISDLLTQIQLEAGKVHQIAFTTVTGIAVPSIDARLMNRIPFSPHLKRMPLFGLGCMGGAAGIARMADYLVGHPTESALLLSIELCSLTIQQDDLSPENMVSTGLFGDGAAALLMVGAEHPLARTGMPRVVANRSVFFHATEHIMGWDMRDTGFKIVLDSDVAQAVDTVLRPALDTFLEEHHLTSGQIERWLVHPGGPKIIRTLETGLGLMEGALHLSWENLASVGNLSSAAVLAMLERTFRDDPPPAGSYGLLMAMGPGFSAELVLLRW